ncbi:hypothetical protein [Rheinheimera sp. MMS21-TC3]|uniref:hypothetical protein n=1 Tax=Rheinheimera sp. MMS21-TC3 TaxID=3072790 RepID=UPI0028C4DEC2|nr:hypothetical protein [Rheinheimera sp. MMS21-TC3]WNO60861.1 hypothetical protein RDV63_07830 [Rheinheimera sp. MMS21-TC3]
MRFQFCINATKDLNAWKVDDKFAYVQIVAILQQISSDPQLEDMLLERSADNDGISFSRWVQQFRKGNDLYRIKTITPEGYSNAKWRIIYAYLPISRSRSEPEFHILALPHRDKFDYDNPEDCITKRIIADLRLLY